MAWYNPSTWSAVDKLQGQSSRPTTTPGTAPLDPNKVRYTLNGVSYNYGGDPIKTAKTGGSSSAVNDYLAALDALTKAQAGANREVYAPNLDLASISAKARKEAAKAVNPYYTKTLNTFLAEQGARKQQEKAQYEMNVKNLEDELKNTLEGNEITKGRTTEDVAANQAEIAQTEDYYQTDEGTQQAIEQIAEAKQLAQSGLTGGLGAQQKEASQTARNTTEKRQGEQFDKKRAEQEIFKARTFEDLERAGKLATGAKEKGAKQAKFDLDSFIKNQSFAIKKTKAELARNQREEIANKTRTIAQTKVNKFIQSIADPARRSAAYSAYGNAF